jgi:hypothetical protein
MTIRSLETRLSRLEGAKPNDCKGGWQLMTVSGDDSLPDYDPTCRECSHPASQHTAPGRMPVFVHEVIVQPREEAKRSASKAD